MENHFKDKLNQYESPLSQRVSFDNVIAKTKKTNTPIWFKPFIIATTGIFVVTGISIVAYYANYNKVDNQNTNQSNIIASTTENPSLNTITQPNLLALPDNSDLLTNNAIVNTKLIALTNKAGSISNKKPYSEIATINSENATEKVQTEIREEINLSTDDNLHLKSDVKINSNATDVTVTSTTTENNGVVKQEIEIDKASSTTKNNFDLETTPNAESKEINQNIASVEKVNQKQVVKDNLLTPTTGKDKKEATLTNKKATKKPWGLQVTIAPMLNSQTVNPNANTTIKNNAKRFELQALVTKEIGSFNLGTGLSAESGTIKSVYNKNENVVSKQISTRTVIIKQPGLPDIVKNITDTTLVNKVNISNQNSFIRFTYIGVPLSAQVRLFKLGDSRLSAAYTANVGYLMSQNGVVANSNELVVNPGNSFVINNELSLLLQIPMDKHLNFIMAPSFRFAKFTNVAFNLNNNQYGGKVGVAYTW